MLANLFGRFLVRKSATVENTLVDKLLLLHQHHIKFFFLSLDYALVVIDELCHAFVDTLRD